MANTFKNGYKDLTTSNQDIVPAVASATTTIVLTLRCTNVDGTNDATVDVEIVKASSGGNAYIAKTLSVPADTANPLTVVEMLAPQLLVPSVVVEFTDKFIPPSGIST